MQKILLLVLLAISTLFSSQMGTVYGLDPNGDGFLSIRKKPKSTETARLYNGDKVEILDKSGKWYKVKDVGSNKVGWSHGKWISIDYASSSTKSEKEVIYYAKLSRQDHFNARSGKEITAIAYIIQQDRANYHKYNKRDSEDTNDNLFDTLDNRKRIKGMISRGYISSETKDAIHNGFPYVKVTVLGNRMDVEKANSESAKTKKMIETLSFGMNLKDKKVALRLLSKDNPKSYRHFDKSLLKDKDVAKAMIEVDNIMAVQYIDNSLKNDVNFMFDVFKDNPNVINYIDESLSKNKDFIAKASKYNGMALLGADESLAKDKDFILEILKNNKLAYEYIDDSLKNNPDILELISQENDQNHIEWLSETNEQCVNHGGELYQDNCEISLSNAREVCSKIGGRLPSISELEKVALECGAKINDSQANRSNSTYQLCYQKKGFSAESMYWSGTSNRDDIQGFYFKKGNIEHFLNNLVLNVRCINKSMNSHSVDESKKKREKRKVSNATSNKDEMDCSEIADWLMKDMPDSFKEACNKQTENNTNTSSWTIPDKKTCLDNGGEMGSNGVCKSTWKNAQKICIENKSSLSTINELENLVTSCGGNIDQNNKDNVSYHKCYKEKGFAADLDYWSSSLTEISHTPRMLHVSLGSVYSGGKYTLHSVMCSTK